MDPTKSHSDTALSGGKVIERMRPASVSEQANTTVLVYVKGKASPTRCLPIEPAFALKESRT